MMKFLLLACVTGVTLSSFSVFAGDQKPALTRGLRNEDYGNKPTDTRAPASMDASAAAGNMPSMSPDQLRQAREAVEALRKAQERNQKALDAMMQE